MVLQEVAANPVIDVIAFVPIPGALELSVILIIFVLLFGHKRIPKLARNTGQAIGEFRRGKKKSEQDLEQLEEQLDDELDSSDDESQDQHAESVEEPT